MQPGFIYIGVHSVNSGTFQMKENLSSEDRPNVTLHITDWANVTVKELGADYHRLLQGLGDDERST